MALWSIYWVKDGKWIEHHYSESRSANFGAGLSPRGSCPHTEYQNKSGEPAFTCNLLHLKCNQPLVWRAALLGCGCHCSQGASLKPREKAGSSISRCYTLDCWLILITALRGWLEHHQLSLVRERWQLMWWADVRGVGFIHLQPVLNGWTTENIFLHLHIWVRVHKKISQTKS